MALLDRTSTLSPIRDKVEAGERLDLEDGLMLLESDELLAWEVFSNCKWAIGALTQARRHLRGEERSVELAILGRLAAEMEYELLDLIEKVA